MSRSAKGKKPTGWDYWGKRPIGMGADGSTHKRIGIQIERAQLKRETLKQPLKEERDQFPEEDPQCDREECTVCRSKTT